MSSHRDLRRNLKYSNHDSFLSSVMVGAGETFLPAFALALGLSQVTSGLLAAIPFLVASVVQLAAPWAVSRLGSYRRWLTRVAYVQGLCFIPLAWGAYQGQLSPAAMFALVTLYWTCGLASGPAWNSWMSSIVPWQVRARYFAFRSRLGQIGLLFGLVTAGLLLEFCKRSGTELLAFASLFAVAGVFRMTSAWCLSRQTERPRLTEGQKRIPLSEMLARLWRGRDGRLVFFLAVFGIAVNISGPFFNPYMLGQLRLPYFDYMVLIAASFLTKIMIFPKLGTWGKRVGPFRLLQISVLATATLPLLWMVSTNYVWLIVVQMLSGLFWAIFDLGVMLALFEAIRDEERTGFLAFYNFINALAVTAGTLIGAKVLSVFGEKMSTYMTIFALSAAGRLLCSIVLDAAVLRPGERYQPAASLAWISEVPKRIRIRARAEPASPSRGSDTGRPAAS